MFLSNESLAILQTCPFWDGENVTPSKVNRDLQRLGMKRSRLESPVPYLFHKHVTCVPLFFFEKIGPSHGYNSGRRFVKIDTGDTPHVFQIASQLMVCKQQKVLRSWFPFIFFHFFPA